MRQFQNMVTYKMYQVGAVLQIQTLSTTICDLYTSYTITTELNSSHRISQNVGKEPKWETFTLYNGALTLVSEIGTRIVPSK